MVTFVTHIRVLDLDSGEYYVKPYRSWSPDHWKLGSGSTFKRIKNARDQLAHIRQRNPSRRLALEVITYEYTGVEVLDAEAETPSGVSATYGAC